MLTCVNLGCGKLPFADSATETWYNIDRIPASQLGIDVVKFKIICRDFRDADCLSFFKDDSVDIVNADNIFEHLGDEFIPLMNEIWRILKPTGFLHFAVPRFPHDTALMHPEHKRFFVQNSFAFWQVPDKGIDPQGYLNGKFWHVILKSEKETGEMIFGDMFVNKPHGRFDFVEVKE